VAADDYDETTGAPVYLGTGAPESGGDLTEVAAFAALVGTRLIGTTAERTAFDYAREGIAWWDTDDDTLYVHNGSGWDPVFHDWKSYTPTPTNLAPGNGTLVGRYARVGKLIHVVIELTAGTTTSISGGVSFALPVTPASALNAADGVGVFRDNSTGDTFSLLALIAGGVILPRAVNAAGTYASAVAVATTAPVAIGSGDTIYLHASYRGA